MAKNRRRIALVIARINYHPLSNSEQKSNEKPLREQTIEKRQYRIASWLFFGVAVLGFVFRLAPWYIGGRAFAFSNVDSTGYVELARGLKTGCGFAKSVNGSCGAPETLRTPGYPLLLLLFPGTRANAVFASFCGAVGCIIIGFFLTSEWGIGAGLVASILFATDLPSIFLSSQIMSDSIFQFVLILAIVLQLYVLRHGRADLPTVIGVSVDASAFGLSALVRPLGAYIWPIAWVPLLLVHSSMPRKRIQLALLAATLSLLPIAFWSTRNLRATGTFTLSTAGSINLYYVAAAITLSDATGTPLAEVVRRFEKDSGVSDFFETPPSLERKIEHSALEVFLHHRLSATKVAVLSLLRIAFAPTEGSARALFDFPPNMNPGEPFFKNPSGRIRGLLDNPDLAILMGMQLVQAAIIWTGVVLSFYQLRSPETRPFQKLTLGVLLSSAAILLIVSAGPQGEAGRMRMSAIPFLDMLAGVGLSNGLIRQWIIRDPIGQLMNPV